MQSNENIQRIFKVCKSYLFDRFQISVLDDQLNDIIRNIVSEHNKQNITLELFNKQVILKVKDHFINKPEEEPTEEDFFSKLEKLEIQRNTTLPQPNTPVKPLQFESAQPQQIIQPQSNGPSVIYVPNVKKASTSFIINSLDRDWQYFTDRATIQWSGHTNFETKISLNSIFFPESVATKTPIIFIKIDGVGNNTHEIPCHLFSKGFTWDIWKPASKELAIMKSIAIPWIITFHDCYNNLIDIGNDGAIISEYDKLLNNNVKIKLTGNINIDKGDYILIKKHKKTYKIRVINIVMGSFIYEVENNKEDINLIDGIVCNLNKQITILFENLRV